MSGDETSPSVAFDDLLQRGLEFDATYAGGLSNHLPMALVAAARLGATCAQLEAGYSQWSRRLEPRHQGAHKTAVEKYAARIASVGLEGALAECVPALVPGLAASAFHGIIRTAYGIEAGSDEEVAQGLAHWESTFFKTDEEARPTGEDGRNNAMEKAPQSALKTLSSLHESNELRAVDWDEPTIVKSFLRVLATPEFVQRARPLSPEDLEDEGGLACLREVAMRIFAASKNFTALHLVTGAHALRVLAPYFGNLERATQVAWRAFQAAYVEIGLPDARAFEPDLDTVPSWIEIRRRALVSFNDHTVKFVHSCQCEESATGDVRYRALAALRTP